MAEAAYFPWSEVNACRTDRKLQGQHSIDEGMSRFLGEARPCLECNRAAEDLAWFYFMSSPESWESLAGTGGWMTVCDECHVQVDLFVDIIN